MNRTVLGVAVILVAVAGYLFWANQTEEAVRTETPAPAPAPAPEPAPEVTQEQAEDSLDEAVTEAQEAADAVAAQIEERVPEAVDAAREMANDAAEALENAVSTTAGVASDAANEAAERLDALRQQMAERNEAGTVAPDVTDQDPTTAETNAGDASSAAAAELAAETDLTAPEVRQVLSTEGFDYDRAVEVIAASDLSDTNKTLLRTVLDQARNSPALLAPALAQVRSALGL